MSIATLPRMGWEFFSIDGDTLTLCPECASKTTGLTFQGFAAAGVPCNTCGAVYQGEQTPKRVELLEVVTSVLKMPQIDGECSVAQVTAEFAAAILAAQGITDFYSVMHKALHLAARWGYYQGKRDADTTITPTPRYLGEYIN